MSENLVLVWEGGVLFWWINKIMKVKGELNIINIWDVVKWFLLGSFEFLSLKIKVLMKWFLF